MNSREVAWRAKAPEGFEARVEEAQNTRMYLIQEIGPTAFVIKEADSEDATEAGADDDATERARRRAESKKFKVQIGGRMRCSCKNKGELPCIHLLFVLLKLLRVPSENPLLWQGSLLDNEVDQILRGRFTVVSDKKKRGAESAAAQGTVERKPIEEDDVCPICQEDMDEATEVLTYCKQGCGKSVHAKCMKVWAEHKQSVGEKVTCPFCREDWGPLAVENIKKEIRSNRRPSNVHYGVKCSACRCAPVTGDRFRCLVCADYDLCSTCFARNVHTHHSFVKRSTTDAAWEPAVRAARRAEIAAMSAQMVQEMQGRELTVEDYEMLLQLDRGLQPLPLHEHLSNTLRTPDVSEVAAACARGEGLCSMCSFGVNNGTPVKELRCTKLVHQACIESHLVSDRSMKCPCCSIPMFLGIALPTDIPTGLGTGNGSNVGQRPAARGRQRRPRDEARNTEPVTPSMDISFAVTGRNITGEEIHPVSDVVHARPAPRPSAATTSRLARARREARSAPALTQQPLLELNSVQLQSANAGRQPHTPNAASLDVLNSDEPQTSPVPRGTSSADSVENSAGPGQAQSSSSQRPPRHGRRALGSTLAGAGRPASSDVALPGESGIELSIGNSDPTAQYHRTGPMQRSRARSTGLLNLPPSQSTHGAHAVNELVRGPGAEPSGISASSVIPGVANQRPHENASAGNERRRLRTQSASNDSGRGSGGRALSEGGSLGDVLQVSSENNQLGRSAPKHSGKVGRHAITGRRHAGGSLKSLIGGNNSGDYETTLG